MENSHVWHLWPGRHWPLLAREEAAFIADLTLRAPADLPAFDRDTLIAVLNALRCGITVDDLLHQGPGLRPDKLLAAYRHLDGLLTTASVAWSRIVEAPTLAVWVAEQHRARPLMHSLVDDLNRIAAEGNARVFAGALRTALSQSALVHARVADIEARLESGTASPTSSIALGRLLYDPYDPQLWGDPHFVPDRVGALMPVRVRELLGEPRR